MSKRNRSANFSPVEKRIFLRLIDKYKDNLDKHNSDGTTNHKRTRTWIHLTNVFNRLSPGHARDVEQLKQKMSNMRKAEKKRTLKQVSHTGSSSDEFMCEKIDESIDYSMDPLDFEGSETDDSFNTIEQSINNVEMPTTSANNDNVLDLLEDFVVNLRKKGSSVRSSIDMNQTYADASSNLNGIKIERILTGNDVLNICENSTVQRKPAHTEEKTKKRVPKNDALDALERKLVERKIVLCNLQIEIARKQLAAFSTDKPTAAEQ